MKSNIYLRCLAVIGLYKQGRLLCELQAEAEEIFYNLDLTIEYTEL
jgi:hypothetical protein